jgi:hypothetical protein
MNGMFKYLCHLTATVYTSLKSDNHRGEPRLERNIMDALLTEGKIVHATTDVWRSPLPRPDNLYDMNLDWMDSSIQMSYGVPHEIHTGVYPAEANPKYRVVHYHDGPSEQTKDTFLKYDRQRRGSIVATCSSKSGHYVSRLESTLGRENVEWVCGPSVPCVFEEHDPINQPNLFWVYRNFCKYADNDPAGMRRLFNQVGDYLRSNQELRLVVLAQPHNEISKAALDGDCKQWFLNFPFAHHLRSYSDRIDVLTNIPWSQVLEIMSKTRLVISPAEPLGAPPFEAGSYGVPVVLGQGTNPFQDGAGNAYFSEVIRAPEGLSGQFFDLLDRLYSDSSFYHNSGNAYRTFVKGHATYKAYVEKLEDIQKRRGWQVK